MADVTPFVLPDARSWLARIYVYWLKVTNSRIPRQENFCHFWRVILIWAPLEWLYMTKRGWRGWLRPYEFLALIPPLALYVWLILFTGKFVVEATAVVVVYGLAGMIGMTAIFQEELDKRDLYLRLGLYVAWAWGAFFLALIVVWFVVMGIGVLWNKRPRSEPQPPREKKPSETWEFICRLWEQVHPRICPPVEFKFDIWQATGRKKRDERWDPRLEENR